MPDALRLAMDIPLEDQRSPDFPKLTLGLFEDLKAASAMRGKLDTFRSDLSPDARRARLDGWAAAVKSVIEAAH